MTWDGARYQRHFDALAASGVDVHGEAAFVMTLEPRSVLDAGCGTGRVARELAACGVDVVGVDADASMIASARELDAGIEWITAPVDDRLDLGRQFDVVLMAGNVPLFTPRGTRAALVAGCAHHVAPGGALVCGFQLGYGYGIVDYDDGCRAAGFEPEARWSTWEGAPFTEADSYAVSVHRAR